MGIGEDSFSFQQPDTSMAAFTWEGKENNNEAPRTLSISEEVRTSQVKASREEAHERRRQASMWVEHMTDHRVPAESDEAFCATLKNGEVLCKLLNEMSPGVIQRVFEGSSPMPTIYNIDCFFQAAVKVGLSKDDLFHASDLDDVSGPVVDCILRLKSLWLAMRKEANQATEQVRTPILGANSANCNYELKTPPMPVSMPVLQGRASAIKSAKGRGLQAAVSVTRLMQQCTSLLKDRMWSDSPNPSSISPLSACSTSPERTVEALGPVIESVLSSLTQEYERRLLQKESDLKKTKNDLFTTKEKLESMEKSDKTERIKEKQINVAIENKRVQALQEELEALRNQQAMTKQRAIGLQSETKELKDMCKSIKLDAMLEISDFQIELSQLEHHLGHLFGVAKDYSVLCDENRKLYNEVLDLKGNIRVYTRVRPAGTTGSEEGSIVNVDNSSDMKDMITLEAGSSTSFAFEKAFDQSSTQADVYDEVAPFIRPVLDGYNVCLFAYGQTGSGKTHTMAGGDGKDRGVNIRAIEDLFQIIQRNGHESSFEVKIQMLEIYNEQLRDLLDENQEKKLEIRSAPISGVNVPGVIIKNVQSVEEVLHFMEFGQQNRAIGATAMNERSSRSHSVFTIHVSSESRLSGSETHACLHLIDLAGSERVGRSEATGERLKEAQHINKSLSALGDVISALASKQGHIPYRNSKLTHLLQDSLNGNAKVLMLSHIAPEEDNCSETISTLHFATRVSNVTLGKAKKNLVANTKKQEEDLTKKEDEIRKLRSLLAAERKTTKELKKKTSVEKSPKASARRQSFDNRKPIRPASAAVTRRRSLENQNPVRPASAITKKQSPQVEQRDSSRRPLSAANSLRAKPADKTKSRWM
jgi:kinesin family protein C2/C3